MSCNTAFWIAELQSVLITVIPEGNYVQGCIQIFYFGGGGIFPGGGVYKKLKNASKMCLCIFLLRFYESEIYFGGGGLKSLNPSLEYGLEYETVIILFSFGNPMQPQSC